MWKERVVVQSWHLPGGIEGKQKQLQSGWPVFSSGFEPGTFKIQSRSATNLTVMFGDSVAPKKQRGHVMKTEVINT